MKTMMNNKYAVWQRGKEETTKEYLYAKTHREASATYRENHDVSIHNVETRKV